MNLLPKIGVVSFHLPSISKKDQVIKNSSVSLNSLRTLTVAKQVTLLTNSESRSGLLNLVKILIVVAEFRSAKN